MRFRIATRTAWLVLVFVAAFTRALPAEAAPHIAASAQIVVLLTGHRVRERPAAHGKLVAFVDATRPITGERTVLPVIAQAIGNHGRVWLEVRLPGHTVGAAPPPTTGWITASHTQLSTTPWHLVVELGARRLLVYRDGRRLRSYPAIVGKPSTPTPVGEYFVEETVRMPAGEPGAPFALATSDRSDVLKEFDGGPGQIAIHGLENLGGQLGTAESHGCVRLANSVITWLATLINPGVPITILRA